MADQFNAAELLKLGEKKLTVRLGECSAAQLRELIAAERAQGATARSGVLKVLAAELDARAAELTPESVELIAAAAHRIADDAGTWDDLSDEARANVVLGVRTILASPGQALDDADEVFVRAVVVLSMLFNQIEALSAQLDAAPERETVGPGSVAERVPPADDKAQGKLLDQVACLAFCEGDVIRFKQPASREDFDAVEGLATRYRPRVVLSRRKPRVRVDTVVALDAEGRPLARRTWAKALEGGGGTEAVFPARSISFEL